MKAAAKLFVLLYRIAVALPVLAAAAILALMLFGVRPYAVRTGSMEPAIPVGSLCFVNQRAPIGEIRVGDVIAYRAGELTVTHRAVRIDESGITTKGDANNTEDTGGRVTEENFIGKILFWVPVAGKLLLGTRTVQGKLILAGAILLLLAGGLLCDKVTGGREAAPDNK